MPAVAVVLPESEVGRTTAAIRDRYGPLGRLLLWRQERRARRMGVSSVAAIEIVLEDSDRADG